jgi:hypothetical protein
VAAGLAAPAWSAAAARRDELLEDGLWVAGLALPILVSHQSEECAMKMRMRRASQAVA